MKTLTLCALLLPLAAIADTPWDGTWVSREDSAVMDKKPINMSLAKGVWKNDAVAPPMTVKADGTDQAVKGYSYIDTIAVRDAGADAVETTAKKAGKIVGTSRYSVSTDGKTLTRKWTDESGSAPASGETVYERVGKGPSGSHAISGAWRVTKYQNLSASAKSVTYKGSADGISVTTPTGQSYDAKFDGKQVPVNGDPGGTMVSLKRVSDHKIVETDHRKGKVVEVDTYTLSPDGKTIKVEWEDKEVNRKGSFTMEKSP
jgi:hypothetical protein